MFLLMGALSALWTFQWFFDYTAWAITEKCTEKLQDSILAWEENLSYTTRFFHEGRYCYIDSGVILCPERNISLLEAKA